MVDNTNISRVEMAPYVQVAAALGYEVEVVRVRCDPRVAAQRNVHGVPSGTVYRMYRDMERPVSYWACTYREVVK